MRGQQTVVPRQLCGIVLLDKPAGATSNQVLQRTKRLFQAAKAGHTGSLDPMATGMLPVCFGAATKVSGLMLESSKHYRVSAVFGVATNTGDADGEIIEQRAAPPIAEGKLLSAIDAMQGEADQVPPMFSAVKHQGRRLYELARQGREVPRKARRIVVYSLHLEQLAWPEILFTVHCSKGTYVRTLVTDLAASLGTLGHVTALRRLSVDPFSEAQMVALETLEADAARGLGELDRHLLGVDTALQNMPRLDVGAIHADKLTQGQRVPVTGTACPGEVRMYDPDGIFVGIGEVLGSGELRPRKIFPGEALGAG